MADASKPTARKPILPALKRGRGRSSGSKPVIPSAPSAQPPAPAPKAAAPKGVKTPVAPPPLDAPEWLPTRAIRKARRDRVSLGLEGDELETFLAYLREGQKRVTAASAIGLSKNTLKDWLIEGRKGNPAYRDFHDDVLEAEAIWQIRAIRLLNSAQEMRSREWQSTAWLVERRAGAWRPQDLAANAEVEFDEEPKAAGAANGPALVINLSSDAGAPDVSAVADRTERAGSTLQ